MSSFEDQIRLLKTKYEQRITTVVGEVVKEVAETVIEQSPWGDWPAWSPEARKRKPMPPYRPGLFKGSWNYGLVGLESEIDATGTASRNRIARGVSTASGRGIAGIAGHHSISNGVSYAQLMESGVHLVGHNIGLGHMLQMARLDFQAAVRRAVAKL